MNNETTKINIGDTAYYLGLNYIYETEVFDIYDDKIHLNNGVIREISDLGEDVFLEKEIAISKLARIRD